MKISLIKILLLLIQLAVFSNSSAGGFSYVYIQGDKALPFYVKFEDMMLPRYGKNYCIIPQLIPGEINIQILFQQNSFPAQKFTIVVPQNGFRGFLLLQKNGVFSLYDIQQQFYLYPGNKAEDDKVATSNAANAYITTNTLQGKSPDPDRQIATEPAKITYNTVPAKKRKDTGPKFISNVELSNERQVQQAYPEVNETIPPDEVVPGNRAEAKESVDSEQPNIASVNNNINFRNSDCPAAITERDFEDLRNKVQDRVDKTRLKFLLTKVTECYTCNHARILAGMLNNDPERYTFFKKIYPRITDQYNFAVLEDMLATQEWKDYFKLILPK